MAFLRRASERRRLILPRDKVPATIVGICARQGVAYGGIRWLNSAMSFRRVGTAGREQSGEMEGHFLDLGPCKRLRSAAGVFALVCLPQGPIVRVMAAVGGDFRVVVLVRGAVCVHQPGCTRVHLCNAYGVARTQGQLGVGGGPFKEGAPQAREPVLEVGAEVLGHSTLPAGKILSLEEQADLRHEVRAWPIPGQVHGHLKLRRRKETVNAAGLAVKVVLHAGGANQVRVARSTARCGTFREYLHHLDGEIIPSHTDSGVLSSTFALNRQARQEAAIAQIDGFHGRGLI